MHAHAQTDKFTNTQKRAFAALRWARLIKAKAERAFGGKQTHNLTLVHQTTRNNLAKIGLNRIFAKKFEKIL